MSPEKWGSPGTLCREYEGTREFPEGLYDGHDLWRQSARAYSVGATPREAIIALCKVRLGKFGGTLTEIPCDSSDPRFEWGYRFTADGTGCKAAGIYVPGGVILTWWK